ncbi:MAG: acyl-CoA synthetase FdrA [Armatimonadota bacterium]|nr:acyl-CoA synthetase FdrA [Armatimonadota bacterium]MDR5696224.1 acyl-CoA synthetase FdrA [Armatimonadota bacterium]
MVVRAVLRKGSYHDSVSLMQAQRALRDLPGVEEAGIVMGTPANLEMLRAASLDAPELARAGPDDLVVVVRAHTEAAALDALGRIDALLTRRPSAGGEEYLPKSIRTARATLEGANLALVSVPGRFAAPVAEEALREGLHVMVFSDNVPVDDEVRLKALAAQRGLLVMGPDCGTALIGGVGLGFANAVRRGPVGIVAASGTGLQEVSSLLHRWGSGVSHALGTGGRDLSDRVGGAAFEAGLAALAADERTRVIVLLSKPPSAEVAGRVLAMAAGCGKPVVVNFLGAAGRPPVGDVHFATTLHDAAAMAAALGGVRVPEPEESALPALEAFRSAPGARWIRGLYSGGTLCAEAQVVVRDHVGPVWSNAPLELQWRLDDPLRSREHTVVDLGADEFTVGRLHPMLDPEVRNRRIVEEAADPEVAVVLLDVVLGYGAHPDPAGEVASAVEEAQRKADRRVVFVASVCGTDADPQGHTAQITVLREAGVHVEETNARAARFAGRVAEAVGARTGDAPPLAALHATQGSATVPRVSDAIQRLLRDGPRVVNVGLALFEQSLRAQGTPVVSVDWRPPAGGDAEMMNLLAKLGG